MFKRDNMSEVCTEAQVYEDVKRVELYLNLPFYFGVSANMKPLYLVTQFVWENASLTFPKAIRDQVISHHCHVMSIMQSCQLCRYKKREICMAQKVYRHAVRK